MPDTLDIRVEENARGMRIILPPRRFDARTKLAGALMSAAGGAIVAMRFLLFKFVGDWHFATVGALMLFRGARVFFPGRGVLVIQDGWLILSWRGVSKRRVSKIGLVQMCSLEIEYPAETWTRLWKRPAMLSAATTFGSRVPIVKDYPQSTLMEIAQFLRPIILKGKQFAEGKGSDFSVDTLQISDVTDIPLEQRDVMFQPTSSRISHSFQGEMETFTFPKGGQATQFMFILALILIAVGVIAGVFTFSLLFQPGGGNNGNLPLGIVLMVSGTIVGLALAFKFYRSRRSMVIVVTPESLTCVTQGPIGSKERHWSKVEIASIVAQGSERHRKVVVMRADHGRSSTLISGTEAEMWWLATQCRRVLKVRSLR